MKALFLGSIIRHLLTAGGGAAAATSGDPYSAQAIAGAFVTLVGFALSLLEKRARDA